MRVRTRDYTVFEFSKIFKFKKEVSFETMYMRKYGVYFFWLHRGNSITQTLEIVLT